MNAKQRKELRECIDNMSEAANTLSQWTPKKPRPLTTWNRTTNKMRTLTFDDVRGEMQRNYNRAIELLGWPKEGA